MIVLLSLLVVSALAGSPATPAASTTSTSTLGKSCNPNAVLFDCSDCTLAPSYAFCNATTKRCQCQTGFTGYANQQSQCTCASPSQVYFPATLLSGVISTLIPVSFGFGAPVCINYNNYVALQADQQLQAQHTQQALTFLSNTIYPAPVAILATLGNPALNTLLTPDVTSRISPVGEFDGFQGVVEYFYGFVGTPGFKCQSVNVLQIAAQGNTVGAKVNLFLNNSNSAFEGGYPPQLFNLSLFAFFTFADSGLISSIDVSVPNLGDVLDIPSTNPGFNTVHVVNINATCAILTLSPVNAVGYPGIKANGTCGGITYAGSWAGATEVDRYNSCVHFYNFNIPYGTHDRINSNTFVCRQVHAQLTYFSPDVHCVHCGMTGGDSCIDFSYASFFQNPPFNPNPSAYFIGS